MSLINAFMENLVIIDKTTKPDGYGGVVTEWTEGAEFKGAVTFDTSMQARTAEKDGVTSLYTVTTPKTIVLRYHDVFKRLKDGQVFRVTSDGDDKKTPDTGTLNMRQVTAEKWVLPND